MEIWITLIICVTCIGITALIVSAYKRNQTVRTENNTITKLANTEVQSSRGKLLVQVYSGLSFNDFIAPDLSLDKTHISTVNYLNNMMGVLGNQAIQTIRLINDKKYILAEYPKHIAEQLGNGSVSEVITKSGEKILVAKDSVTGQFIAHARKAETTTKLNELAAMGNLIVGAAHLISGYDNAKKLGGLVKDVSRLHQLRGSDMLAELEAIYESIQELNFEDQALEKSHITHLKHDLKVLRNKWFNEIFSALKNIEDPNIKGIIDKWFTTNNSVTKKYETEEERSLVPLHIIRRSLELERSLAIALGSEEDFIDKTLRGQWEKVLQLKDLIKEKRSAISKYTKSKLASTDSYLSEADQYLLSIEMVTSKKAG